MFVDINKRKGGSTKERHRDKQAKRSSPVIFDLQTSNRSHRTSKRAPYHIKRCDEKKNSVLDALPLYLL